MTTQDQAPQDQASASHYVLGHDEREWDRLEQQHRVWRDTLLTSLDARALGPGTRVLEVGCGNGALLRDLAERVGSSGRAVGVERNPEAVARARAALADLPWTTVHEADVFELDGGTLGGSFDLVVMRWVLSFLPSPERVLERVVDHLRPGGLLVVQDYNYDGIRVEPPQPGLELLFRTVPKVYEHHGGDAWIATRLPRLYSELGLELVAVEPHCKAGGPDSDAFRWAERFFHEHLQTFVDDGLMTEAERDAALTGWADARITPGSVFFSPLVVNVIGRR
ncbi:MAG: methyltransferase domain-containing protein [Acidobacteriota bacterium]